MSERFDYVKFDSGTTETISLIKRQFIELEETVKLSVKSPRAKALVLTKLEEAYMWVGKGLRDDMIEKTGGAESQEQRSNS